MRKRVGYGGAVVATPGNLEARLRQVLHPFVFALQSREPRCGEQSLRSKLGIGFSGHRERGLEPRTAFDRVAVELPVPRQRDAESECQVAPPGFTSPSQRGPHVFELGVEPVGGLGLTRAQEHGCRRLREPQEFRRVAFAQPVDLIGIELLFRVFPERLEHPEAHFPGPLLRHDER